MAPKKRKIGAERRRTDECAGEKRGGGAFPERKGSRAAAFFSLALVPVLATFCGALNSYHQYVLFENYRHFSHLSTLEREMTFRTEMGLYYSYFKTIVESKSISEGLHNIMYNNLTEYPSTINTLKRFNLYPEVILGIGYRFFVKIAHHFQINIKQCWTVSRGDDLPPVESCEGLGEPAYFYITAVFLWNGLVSGLIFLYGKMLSNSFLGGILAVSGFFFNHGEATRVQWTPPLRESFAYPILLAQMLMITKTLRDNRRSWNNFLIISILTIISILFWQFSQFVLLTQIMAIFVTYMLGYVATETLQMILISEMCSLLISYVLMFGNEMLLTSFFASTLLISYFLSVINKSLMKFKVPVFIWIFQLLTLLVGSFSIKLAVSFILQVKHDDHILNILKSKFTSYKDFHTLLYTCAAEFDFMDFETIIILSKTLLLPSAIATVVCLAFQIFGRLYKKNKVDASDGAVAYNVFQLGAFSLAAVLVMRLKLFFTPHLCIATSMLASIEHFGGTGRYQNALVVLLIAATGIEGLRNVQSQRQVIGEYSNPALEELLEWVSLNTPADAAFAGPMPTMANLMLSTGRPIVNHPHYEDAGLRERTKKVYTLFSRKPAQEVHRILQSTGARYVVLERRWCFGQTREGCRMVDAWDLEDPENADREPLCPSLFVRPQPFRPLFQNSEYAVLQL
ncbi:protein C-mannosyl-transferase DPY19L1-like [Centruroides vittatus]|uniref:protein C-mannosyl-transferase DPY19L1-like n=1 Tax=Centruroides vittatus TaxID=120091 RepID=UPI003510BF45